MSIIARTAAPGVPTVLLSACLAACGAQKSPPAALAGASQPASVDASAAAASDVLWSVYEGNAGGTITDAGSYTAPGTTGTFHVLATSAADPSKSGSAAVTVRSGQVTALADQLAILSQVGIFFGHQSVGGNIMTGVRTLLSSNAGSEPSVVTTASAGSMGPGIWAEASNGSNYDPISKITAFQNTIDGGVDAKVDVAFMKFCWVDFDDGASYWSTGSAQDLFNRYRDALTGLKTRHPDVTFVHFTSPLFTDTPLNVRREQYNNLLRAEYAGKEPVFDLALVESTRPDGAREVGSYGPALVPAYTSDGGHLNATGQDVVARALIALLANLP